MKLNQEKYDKLIAIASSMNLSLMNNGIEKVLIDICHGKNAGTIEIMTPNNIEKFLDTMFECEISYMGIDDND